MAVNIGWTRGDWRVRVLSNFSESHFVIDGVEMASTEGFIQGIKWPEGHPNRGLAFKSHGFAAKKLGNGAEGKFVWWNGQEIVWRSVAHLALIDRVIRAKFEQSQGAMAALLATDGEVITHDLGKPENPNTSLPAWAFCGTLMSIRKNRLGRGI
jgi:predicted NAD-dependent protein-ADP-ribosyltransferase YbiA (DUF1768 family)